MKRSHRPLRQLSGIDNTVAGFDTVLRTLFAKTTASRRANPADVIAECPLSVEQRRHSAGLMRVNHSGEVCAQALYQGQALTAKLPAVKSEMAQAATEEEDHLAWCQARLDELGASPSLLNPVWYGFSFGLGAAAGAVSDKLSLGFVAATEEQVCQHLDQHMSALPEEDAKSRAIITQMHKDEKAHGEQAIAAGGIVFPQPVKRIMSFVAKAMTWTTYRV